MVNRISVRLRELGPLKDRADPNVLNPGLIRSSMEAAMDEHVKLHLDSRQAK